MKVSEYMTRDVVFANLRDGLYQTYERMKEREIHHMPVLDDHERLIGIISDRDLRRPRWLDSNPNWAENFRLDNSLRVEEAMTTVPDVVQEHDDIHIAVSLFLNHRYGAVPVVSSQDRNRVVGILSQLDIIRAFHDHLH